MIEYGAYYPTSREELLVTDENIYYHFFGEFKEGYFYKSPFRPKEKGASFIITWYKNKWKWRDFGRSNSAYDALDLIMQLYDVPYIEALKIIYEEIILGNKVKDYIVKISDKPLILPSVKITNNFKDFELAYWDQGKVSRKDMEFYNIYTGEVWNNDKRVMKSQINKPVFIYVFDKVKKIWKGYNPYASEYDIKFFSNNISGHIQNYNNLGLTGSDILFITGAYKDCIPLNKLHFDAIAPHSENSFLDPWDVDYLKSIYKHIYVFYDNDTTGIKKSIEFSNRYNLNYINIPATLSTETKIIKDPWNVVTEYDYKLLEDIITDKLIRDGV